MTVLSDFAITRRWPAAHPDRLQLYSLNTPNGMKIGIMLEETGLLYEAHLVDIGKDESHTPEFLSLNPNNKIPAIVDPDGPAGEPIGLFESGAILMYLAHKTGRFMPPERSWQVTQWVMWQMGGLGPMAGQLNFFHAIGGKDWEDKRPRDRFAAEVRRLLGVLNGQLDGREWMVDDYSIADIACIGWARAIRNLNAPDLTGWDEMDHVRAWLDRALARPAVQRGLKVTAKQ